MQLVQLVRRFWIFFLCHSAPGFQLWFYFHLYMWVVHWGLLLRLPWRGWVYPCECQVWRWCTCLGHWGSGSTRYSGGVGGWGSRKYSALEVYGNQSWPIHSSILAWRTPSLTEKSGRPQSTGLKRVRHNQSDPVCINARLFFLPVAALTQ